MRPVPRARDVEGAPEQDVVAGDALRIGLALGVLRPLGEPERVVVGERWLLYLCPDDVDTGATVARESFVVRSMVILSTLFGTDAV